MMRQAIARGRVFPQSYSTDCRYGRLSLKACAIFPLMWANADDQGRLCGDPDEIKYVVCPNIDAITKADIPKILTEFEENSLIKAYTTPHSPVIQMLDWWHIQRLQWAWPSRYPPPEGWQDRLRYKRSAKEVVTQNWPSSGESLNSTQVSPQVNSPDISGEVSGEIGKIPPLITPLEKERESSKEKEIEKEKERGNRRGRGNIPSAPAGALGGRSPPSLTGLPLFESLKDTFPQAFGRTPNSRELAQLRDFEKEISTAGGATAEQIHDAFKEACGQNKFSVNYVRAILLDWLGVARGPP